MVLLDVVYNHFGPDGNYLHAYCPPFFNDGAAHALGRGDQLRRRRAAARVRDFFVHNALYWVEEYRFDGLRLDAVHAIRDDSSPLHIACEIAPGAAPGPGPRAPCPPRAGERPQRSAQLSRTDDGQPACADAQWNDDLHHCVHVLLTGETDGYYARLRRCTRRAAGPRAGPGLRVPGRGRAFGRGRRPAGAARRAERPPAFAGLRLLPAEPRPGRQSRPWRAPRPPRRCEAARRGLRLPAAVAARAHALHGRGVRGQHAFPVLLRLRPRAWPRR